MTFFHLTSHVKTTTTTLIMMNVKDEGKHNERKRELFNVTSVHSDELKGIQEPCHIFFNRNKCWQLLKNFENPNISVTHVHTLFQIYFFQKHFSKIFNFKTL